MNLYNDNDPYVAKWLGNLVTGGHLPQGTVDVRSIVDIKQTKLRPFRQCHFFAGIGGWPYALRLAGWPDNREVWTASCPCQPLSSAGQRRGHADERHLWPALYRLVAECRPATIFGEQVASKDGREWLAGVRADLEAIGYAVGCVDLCAAGAGAPHIRQRLFWVADSSRARHEYDAGVLPQKEGPQARWRAHEPEYGGAAGGLAISAVAGRCAQPGRNDRTHGRPKAEPGRLRDAERLGDTLSPRLEERSGERRDDESQRAPAKRDGRATGGLGDADRARRIGSVSAAEREARDQTRLLGVSEPSADFWGNAEWLPCLDGKARRIEPGTFPLVTRLPKDMGSYRPGEASPFRIIRDPKTGKSIGQEPWRIGMLRGYGNAIVPQVAAEFVRAFMETAGLTEGDI